MDSAAKTAKGAFTIVVKKSILGAKVINAQREDLGTDRGHRTRRQEQPRRLCHSFVRRIPWSGRPAFRDPLGSAEF